MFARGALVACLRKACTPYPSDSPYRDNHSNISILRKDHALYTLAHGMMCHRIGGSTRTRLRMPTSRFITELAACSMGLG